MTSETRSDRPAWNQALWSGLVPRLLWLIGLYALELIAISTWLDTATLARRDGLISFVSTWGDRILRSILAFATILLTFGYLKARSNLEHISAQLADTPIAWRFLTLHAGSMLGFALLSAQLFGGQSSEWMAGAWLAAGIAGIVFAGFAFLPPAVWWSLIPARGLMWSAAGLAVMAVLVAGPLGQSLWNQAAGYTFVVVRTLLRPFLSPVISDQATRMIGGPHFGVTIDPTCSGLEGVGLILVFMAAWLWFCRHECRFPHALLAIPVGVTLMWLLNSVRIAALILIGDAGAPGIASGGFHSQAGWIAFNGAAVVFMLAFRRIPWLRAVEPSVSDEAATNPTAFYLIPFLMILAAAMVSRAISSGFEWFYPLRFFAAAAVLWFFRHQYKSLDWRFGWLAPAAGGLVFVLWLAVDWAAGGHTSGNVIGEGLARLSPTGRIGWLTLRVLAAVVTVPIAEELAFRGFLIRRFISADFEAIKPTAFTYAGVLLSSIAFGVLHGDRWLAGTLAGLLYASVFLRQGKLGDAVIAHATTNALLAIWVLVGSRWYFW